MLLSFPARSFTPWSRLALALALSPLSALAAAARIDAMVLPFREVVVSSPVQSTIEKITVREGDSVKEGQLLAQLYAKQEEIEMSRAKSVVEKRQFDHRSAKRLFDDKIVPEDKELEARIELELAQRQYDAAAENVRLRTIASPLGGLVVEKIREAGEAVNATQPLFRIIDITKVFVQFFIRTDDLARFALGQPLQVAFDDVNAGKPFVGKIDFIDPRVDAASGLIRVRVLVDNPEQQIKAGMRGWVTSQTAP
jgi:RND family efflux transporter MFP subunit